MKVFVVLLAVVAAASAGTVVSSFGAQGRSISSQIEDVINDMRDEMPCGFESLGVGPLAPARISSKGVDFQRQSFGVDGDIHDFVLYGLDKFDVKVKANAITSKVNAVIQYTEPIRAEVDQYALQTFIKQRGLTINLRGDGKINFVIEGLKIVADIKYKLGIISRKISIKDLKVNITLDNCDCDITGLLGDGFVNHKLNELIEEFVVLGINDNQDEITKTIEDNVKPALNDFLEQHTLDELIGGGSGEPKPKCVPPTQ